MKGKSTLKRKMVVMSLLSGLVSMGGIPSGVVPYSVLSPVLINKAFAAQGSFDTNYGLDETVRSIYSGGYDSGGYASGADIPNNKSWSQISKYSLSPNTYHNSFSWKLTGNNEKAVAKNGSTLYVLGKDLRAVDAVSGKVLWSVPSLWGEQIAIGSSGDLYVGSSSKFYCFDSNGNKKWERAGNISDFAVSHDGTIIGVGSSNIIALNPDGTVKWNKSIQFDKIVPVGWSIISKSEINLTVGNDDTIYLSFGVTGNNTCIWQTKCAEFGNVKMPN
jgi:hypothetical protein